MTVLVLFNGPIYTLDPALPVARAIADLEGATGVLRRHIAEALIHRRSTLEPMTPAERMRTGV